MHKIKRILCNPWTVTIGGTVSAGAILKLIDDLFGTTLTSAISQFLFQVIGFLERLFIFKMPIWAILISLGVIFSILKWKLKVISIINSPDFVHYTEDIFEDTLYKWQYIHDSKGYHIGKIIAYCPTCGFRIVHQECQKCRKIFINNKTRKQIEAFIRFNIQKKFSVDEFNTIE